MFSHHADNQAIFPTTCPTKLAKKIKTQIAARAIIHKYSTMNRALKTGGLLFKQTKGSAPLTLPPNVLPDAGRLLERRNGRENERRESIYLAFISVTPPKPQQATLRDSHQGNQVTILQSWPLMLVCSCVCAALTSETGGGELRGGHRDSWCLQSYRVLWWMEIGMFPDE